MDFNKVGNLMRQQLGALKELEELLDHDSKQEAAHDISKESIALLTNHVDHLKKVCNTAVALTQYYQPAAKEKVKLETVSLDAEDLDDACEDDTADVKEPVKKTRAKKDKPGKVEPEPVVEDVYDDLLD